MDRDRTWRTIDAERAALADLLEGLSGEEWERPSLCAGWTVRDVAAHVISSPQATPGDVALAMVRARGDFNRCIHDEAKRLSARPVEAIVADYRRLAGSRRHPLGTTCVDPLLDVLVHTQDIALPLGRRHAMPPVAACAAAERVWRRSFPFRARRTLGGFRLAATDIAWSVGEGAPVEGPIEAILLLLTGRTAALSRLTGDGAAHLAQRLGATA
jgi:uncharacterized protein (TIGR03083 family)